MNAKTNVVIAIGLMAWFSALAPAWGGNEPGRWPAREELIQAEKSVQQAMQSDLQALKAREITHSEVAARALTYAVQAESDAEKVLLYKGAFSEYVKDGAFDKALAAVNTLCEQFPDMPAQYKSTMLANALRAVPRKNGGSLYQLLGETKALAAAEIELKKMEAMREEKSGDRAFQLRLGELYVLKGDWRQALPAFARSSDGKAAGYARSEMEGTTTLEAANFWWEYRGRDKSRPLPACNFRGHAVKIYERVLCMGEVRGLDLVTIDKRLAEYEGEYGCRLGDSGAKSVGDAAAEKPNTPHVVRIFPANGAQDVDPSIKFVRIVFDRPMMKSYAFCNAGGRKGREMHPSRSDGSKPEWNDGQTEVLFPVKLLPGHDYRMILNSPPQFVGFKSTTGEALASIDYSFRTRGTAPEKKTEADGDEQQASAQQKDGDERQASAQQGDAPRIVRIEPANGATDVDPNIEFVRIVFDRPMMSSYAFCTSEFIEKHHMHPGRRDGSKPRWNEDQTEITFPVRLLPGHSYRMHLNSKPKFMAFKSKEGTPLTPVTYSFRTRTVDAK